MAWKEIVVLASVLVVWFSLMRFVLPAMGVPTCMSGACGVGAAEECSHGGSPTTEKEASEKPSTPIGDQSNRSTTDMRSEGS